VALHVDGKFRIQESKIPSSGYVSLSYYLLWMRLSGSEYHSLKKAILHETTEIRPGKRPSSLGETVGFCPDLFSIFKALQLNYY
jgi:hypothetical protein